MSEANSANIDNTVSSGSEVAINDPPQQPSVASASQVETAAESTEPNELIIESSSHAHKRPSPSIPEQPPCKRPTIASIMSDAVVENAADVDEMNGTNGEVEDIEDSEWSLVKPHNLSSAVWRFYKKFNMRVHPNHKEKAACMFCFSEKKYKRGTIACKNGTTTGLKKHLQHNHRKEYEKMLVVEHSSVATETSLKNIFPTKPKDHSLTTDDIKRQFKVAAATWAINRNISFQEFNDSSFRKMFEPLNKKAREIVNVSNHGIKEQVHTFGRYAEKSTLLEMDGQELCWTTDHWTGPNDETYSDLTGHYITNEWELESVLLDFKVFVGRTRGEDIYNDIADVLAKFQGDTTMVLDTIGITDTTGNMGRLGHYCRENGRRHAYCTDHVLHRNAILAFDPKGIPLVGQAMKKMRKMIEYFESSTQAMKKLLDFQRESGFNIYKDQPRPKKTLQDVKTRWWSTYRAIRRLRFLKKAIRSLISADEVDCQDMSDQEWLILHQVEITLETMAEYQRILEGECYVTGSLVPIAIYQIRQSYVDVIASADAHPDVVELSKTLLDDFDKRYVPAQDGKVAYRRNDETGAGNRYIGVHQYFFFASLLDPRTASLLPEIMTGDHFKQLKEDVAELMFEKMKRDATNKNNKPGPDKDSSDKPASTSPELTPRQMKQTKRMDRMFRGLDTKGKSASTANKTTEDDASLRRFCDTELEIYLREVNDGTCPLQAEDGSFNNPLVWWKVNAPRFEAVAKLARKFLPIPATSAPSERIWSRASKILSLHRASLSDELVARIMYVKENLRFFRKHYLALAQQETPKNMHGLIELDMMYLPEMNEKKSKLDIGQDDHLLEF